MVRQGFVILWMVIALVMAGCGGGGQASTPTPTPLPPLEVFKLASTRGADIQSFRAVMDMEATSQGENVALSETVSLDRERNVGIEANINSQGQKISFQMIITKDDVFMKLPLQEWTHIKKESLGPEFTGAFEVISNPAAAAKFFSVDVDTLPSGAVTVKRVGIEEVDGSRVDHLAVQMDFTRVWQSYDEAAKKRFAETIAFASVNLEQLDEVYAKTNIRRYDVWVDQQGYKRKIIMEMEMGPDIFLKMNMKMSDINSADIKVEPPQKYKEGNPFS